MAKSVKFSSKVISLEDYKPEWVGADGEVDVEKVSKIIHTLMVDKAKAQDAREDALVEAKDVAVERDEAKTALESKADPDLKAELDKERDKRIQAETQRDEAVLSKDRIEIAAEKGLTPSQAKRLVGKDRDELEADAADLVKDLGLKPGNEHDGDEDEIEEGRTAPRAGLVNGADSKTQESNKGPVDYEAAAASIVGSSLF